MTIKSLTEYVQRVIDFGSKHEHHAHVRLWFRGQSNETWALQPGVYRDTFGVANDKERLLKERHLAQDFRVDSAGLRDGHMDDVDLYFLQQHYGMPTRLLDWSSNALAALYFAVCSEDTSVHGAVFLLDAYGFPADPIAGRGIATSGRDAFRNAIRVIARWDDKVKGVPQVIFPVRPDRFDVRMSLQRAGFTFHCPNQRELKTKHNRRLEKLVIDGNEKPSLKRALRSAGIDDFAVYGDLDSIARNLKHAHGVKR